MQHDETTELALVRAASAGDSQAFAGLIDRYQGVVLSQAYALTLSTADAEEIAQEVFIAAWKQLPGIKWPERFRAWIFAMTRIECLRARRRERKYRPPGARSAAG